MLDISLFILLNLFSIITKGTNYKITLSGKYFYLIG